MRINEFIYTLKVCGLRWFVWFLPIWLVIALMQTFGSTEKFNGKYVNAVRLGNSGLFLIYSQEIQNEIRERINKTERHGDEIRRRRIKEDYDKEFGE